MRCLWIQLIEATTCVSELPSGRGVTCIAGITQELRITALGTWHSQSTFLSSVRPMAYHTPEVIAQTIGQHSYEILCVYVLARGLLTSPSICLLNYWFFKTQLLSEVSFLWPHLPRNSNCIPLGTFIHIRLTHCVHLSHFTTVICVLVYHSCETTSSSLENRGHIFSFFTPIIRFSIWHMVDIHLIFLFFNIY